MSFFRFAPFEHTVRKDIFFVYVCVCGMICERYYCATIKCLSCVLKNTHSNCNVCINHG